MPAELADLYSIDLTCGPELVPFYRAVGFAELQGMAVRHRDSLND